MLTSELIGQIVGFGHAGIMLWLAFEMRDIKREHRHHVEFFHKGVECRND